MKEFDFIGGEDLVFEFKLNICFWGKPADFVEFISEKSKVSKSFKEKIELSDGCCFFDTDADIFYVWFQHPRKIDIIVHETLHLTRYILEELRDTPLNDSTEELYAYYQSFWLRTIQSKLKELK